MTTNAENGAIQARRLWFLKREFLGRKKPKPVRARGLRGFADAAIALAVIVGAWPLMVLMAATTRDRYPLPTIALIAARWFPGRWW